MTKILLKDMPTLTSFISVNIQLAHLGHAKFKRMGLFQQNDAKISKLNVCATYALSAQKNQM